jgi:hypothetical protein
MTNLRFIDLEPDKEEEGASAPAQSGTWRYHSEAAPEPVAWLVKNLLPQTGATLLSGQWGTFKTTVALDISVSAMTGLTFANRFRIKRRGGVVYFAPEGAGGLQSRVSAIARERGVTGQLPFTWRADCPALIAPDAVGKLAQMVEDAAAGLRQRFDVPVVLILVDTLIAAANYTKIGDENDAAMAQRIMSVLSELSARTGALVLGIDHFGKVVETGTRGSSAKESHADTVIALLADRELSGAVTNTRLALRKQRDGIAGIEIPFTPETVQIGTDDDGDPVTRIAINWEKQTEAIARAADANWSKSLRLLRQVLITVLSDAGFDTTPFADGPVVRAVQLDLIRNEFYRQHAADGDERQKTAARRKAFYRAVQNAQDKKLVSTREVDGVQLIWLTKAEAK